MYGAHNCLDQLLDCNSYTYATNTSDGDGNQVCAAADVYCYNQIEYPFDIVFGRDEYDIRYLTPDPFPPTFYVDYLNTPEVQSAIGAYTNFSEGSGITSAAFAATGDDARIIGVTEAVEYLLDHNVSVTLYFGDADYVCNWYGGEAFSYTLSNVPLYTDGTAGFVNITTPDDIVHGEVKTAGIFSFVRIYQSGHEVPFYKPKVALEMLNRSLAGLDIATGLEKVTSNYTTDGEPESTYVNGNGTVMFDVVPRNATYNIGTNLPNPPYDASSGSNGGGSGEGVVSRLDRVVRDRERAVKGDRDMREKWARAGKRGRRDMKGRVRR